MKVTRNVTTKAFSMRLLWLFGIVRLVRLLLRLSSVETRRVGDEAAKDSLDRESFFLQWPAARFAPGIGGFRSGSRPMDVT
jgi:hypothetical protein